jgi:RPA family protein
MSESDDDSIGDREVAYRLFAAEFEDADFSYSESDDDRSPNYVITPTGARVNRLFAVGVLTEVEQVSDDVLRGRIVDPTGAFVTYAGQYQPDIQAFLERAETPTFVAMTGKARTFQPDDSDQVFTSVRPESINEVDAETRDRWTVQAAEQTLARIGHIATALTLDRSGDDLARALREDGVSESLAAGIPIALDYYGTTPTYLDALRGLALDAARVVAGEEDEVADLGTSPNEAGPVSAEALAELTIETSDQVDSEETVDETSTQKPEPSDSSSTASVETGDSTGTAESTERSTSTATESADEAGAEPAREDPSTKVDQEANEVTATTTSASNGDTDSGESGDSEPGSAGSNSPEDLGDFDSEEFELEEETREQVKEEFGTEFQTGTEVDEPGEADIDTPDPEPEESTETEQSDGMGSEVEAEPEPTGEGEPDEAMSDDSDKEGVEEPDDLQAAVVDLMGELDEGDGASKAAVLDEMAERYGVDPEKTEDAIQSALMDGECYEPGDDTLKPI